MNSYWGGAVAACAGCLVFGALPRLRARVARTTRALLGLGIGMSWLCRPYETIFLILSVAPIPTAKTGGRWQSQRYGVAIALLPAVGISLLQNKQITGSWTTLPYQLSQYQYGVPTTFTFQPLPIPHRSLTREQQLDYEQQSQVHEIARRLLAALGRAGFASIASSFSRRFISRSRCFCCARASVDSHGSCSPSCSSAWEPIFIRTFTPTTSRPSLVCSS